MLSLAKTMVFCSYYVKCNLKVKKKNTFTSITYPNLFFPQFFLFQNGKPLIHPDAVKNFPHIPSVWKSIDSTFKTYPELPYFSPPSLLPFWSKLPFIFKAHPNCSLHSLPICLQSTFHTVARVIAFKTLITSNHSKAFNS